MTRAHASRCRGQQGTDLVGGGGVVQHHQGPRAGEPATVGGGQRVRAVRDLMAGHAERHAAQIDEIKNQAGKTATT